MLALKFVITTVEFEKDFLMAKLKLKPHCKVSLSIAMYLPRHCLKNLIFPLGGAEIYARFMHKKSVCFHLNVFSLS